VDNYERILDQSLCRSGNTPPPGDLFDSGGGTSNAKLLLAIKFYENHYLGTIKEFPWGFATRRMKIYPTNKKCSLDYQHVFEIPEQVLQLWDIYVERPNFAVGEYGTAYYRPFDIVYGLGDATGNMAEHIDGHIESDLPYLKIFFTHREAIDQKDFSEPFVQAMIEKITFNMKENKGLDVEQLAFADRRAERERSRAIRLGAKQRFGQKKIKETSLVQKLKGC